ncbi:hypothetical protein [Neobacillus vireti]|uniref:DUF3139 domain-containing protein n=1 Tax=Neobacillus vireti LMG 21834 TaxID=1131730 RepID=A0AB94IQW5_9BACI|nr:hypothetical protein [Neobacillus vireti]ETI69392.1 hypothetical protein BAVI_07406 [Neobacillus vireti LMG 21834]KLT18878.1 hypothetical protein AA980_05905 [Neobacillus vireti]
MYQLFIFVLITITLVLLSMFITGLMEQYKTEKEEQKMIIRDGVLGYLDQTFGFGKVKIFKSILDAEGNEGYVVYLPGYEWFKSPTYQWYEVYAVGSDYRHAEIKR